MRTIIFPGSQQGQRPEFQPPKEALDADKLAAAQAEFETAKQERDEAEEILFGPQRRFDAAQTRVMRADAALKAILRGGRI